MRHRHQAWAILIVTLFPIALGCHDDGLTVQESPGSDSREDESRESVTPTAKEPATYDRFAGAWMAEGTAQYLTIDQAGYVSLGDGIDMFSSRKPCQIDPTGNSFEVEVRLPLDPEQGGREVSLRAYGRLVNDNILMFECFPPDGSGSKSLSMRRIDQ